jgi:hypothetical protein
VSVSFFKKLWCFLQRNVIISFIFIQQEIEMTIQLNPGFSAKIEIKNLKGKNLYEKVYDSEKEVVNFLKTNAKSKPGWSLIKGVVCPLRTDHAKDFTKDFFLPTFVNFVLKINNIALKIFVSLLVIPFDLLTFPIRLVVTPFRAFYNQRHSEEHPLLLIKEKNKISSKEDIVIIHYKITDVKMSEPKIEEGHIFQNAKEIASTGTVRVALKRLPGGIKQKVSGEQVNRSYWRMDDQWKVTDSLKSNSKYASLAF